MVTTDTKHTERGTRKHKTRVSVSVDVSLLDKVMLLRDMEDPANAVRAALERDHSRLCQKMRDCALHVSEEPEQIKADWMRWLEDIKVDVAAVYDDRRLIRRFTAITDDDPELRETLEPLCSCIVVNCAHSAAVAVRRLVQDQDSRTASLRILIEDVIRYHTLITREDYDRYGSRPGLLMNVFDEYAGKGQAYPCPRRLKARLARACSVVKPIRVYADQHVAHLDKSRGDSATFEQLDTAVDATVDLFRWVYRLLTGCSVEFPNPGEPERWECVFTAWSQRRPGEAEVVHQ